jgi:putative MATE family efflux protein
MTKRRTLAEKSLRHERIGRLLLQYSMPAIVAMTVSSLYNIIDRIFIGQGVGPLAISGLALTLPFMNLAIAFGALVGAGASALVSIRMGESRGEEAARILGNMTLLNVVLGTVYSIVMFIFLDQILFLFGASRETLPYAKQFLQVLLVGNVFQHSFMGFNNVMRSSGHPRKAMLVTLSTVGINLVLAPTFIFVLHWGIRGAALATVIAQSIGLIVVVSHFLDRRNVVHFRRDGFAMDLGIVRDIFAIGMSSFVVQVCACLITILINLNLVKHGGDYAVGAFGIINSILMCVVMVVLGLVQGMQPIVGFNYGAKLYPRVIRAFKLTILAGTAVTSFGFLLGQLLPHLIVRAFTSNQELANLAVSGMHLVFAVFPIVGAQIVTSSFFQAIGRAKISVLMSLSRQVVFLIPGLLILPRIFGLHGVWSAMPTADFLASLVTYLVLKREIRKIHGLDEAFRLETAEAV